MMDKLKSWFSSLESREQMLVGFGSIFVIVLLGYVGVIEPVFESVDERAARVQGKSEIMTLLREAAARPASSGAQVQATSSRSLVVVVEQSLRASGLNQSLKRTNQQDTNAVRVQLADAPFDRVVGWLANLSTNSGMRIRSATINSADQIGTVNVNVTLARGS